MNVFEVLAILTPLSGLLAGLVAAGCGDGWIAFFAALCGLVTGISIYPGGLFLLQALSGTFGSDDGGHSASSMPWWVWVIICYATVSPIVAAFISSLAVRWLATHFGGAA